VSSAGQDPLEALRREVEVLRAAAARASMPEEVPEIDVGALLDKVRADADARLIGPARDLHHIGRVSLAAQPIAIRDVYSIEELLDYHDDDFVEAAYRALLRREPDAAGRDNYTRMLLEDRTSRVEVLYHLSRSPEGRQARVRVTGLWVAFAVRRLLQVPVVGRLAGTALYITRLPLLVRNLERQDVIGYRREKQLRAATDSASMPRPWSASATASIAARSCFSRR